MNATHSIANIAIPSPLRRHFDYIVPNGMICQAGARVRVSFGHRSVVGIVLGFSPSSDVPKHKLKAIEAVLDEQPLIPEMLRQLLQWAAGYYHHPIGDVFAKALPVLLRKGQAAEIQPEKAWALTTKGAQIENELLSRAPKQRKALQCLQQLAQANGTHAYYTVTELTEHGIKSPMLKLLKEKELVDEVFQDEKCISGVISSSPPPLLVEQQLAVDAVLQGLQTFSPFLLDGVTGSGKTEVYLSVLENIVKTGGQALILVPEIGLTPQAIARFQSRLPCPVAVMHSGLSDKERLHSWLLAEKGDFSVIIGTRSAIFTPFKALKLIVVDESHDNSYKQWDGFKYHARDIALRRAQLENIPVILGSATPSLVSCHNVGQAKLTQLKLTQRATGASMPEYHLVDCRRQQMQQGFARPVLDAMKEHLQRGNQVLVFLNRRGFAPVLMCHECGWVAECLRCHSPFTIHNKPRHLQCHHCTKSKAMIHACEECDGAELINVGAGTERIEETLEKRFPEHTVVRIDRDSTRKKGALQSKLAAVQEGDATILVGTQMLAKGHHFPNVTLVIMVDIDGGLYSTDFNATESMAQLVLQVAGRAGREDKPGQVLIQTHHPEHPLLQGLIQNGYDAFAKQALIERKKAALPPFSYFALLRAEAVDNRNTEQFLQQVKDVLEQYNSQHIEILGPIPSPIEKRVGRYRWQLLLSAANRPVLHRLIQSGLGEISALLAARKVRWSIDIDPVDLL